MKKKITGKRKTHLTRTVCISIIAHKHENKKIPRKQKTVNGFNPITNRFE